jgi:antitoxin MazE
MSKEFEVARLQMVRAARAGEISNVRGYAWAHRIYPFNPYDVEEAFESDFHIGREASDEVLKAIDDGWRKKKFVSFYDLEGSRDRADGLDRMDIYHICRLAFLDGRFDDSVWKALTVAGSGPIESQGLAKEFEMEHDISY